MVKKTFILNTIMLTSASLIARIIGIGFRVYMSNKIGPEGMGLFQLIGIFYLFCANFAVSGISVAVTRLITDSVAKKEYRKSKLYLRLCLIISVGISLIISSVAFIYSDEISLFILRDDRTALSLRMLSISLPFMAVSACFRGYFYAVRKAFNTASEQLLEQIIEILIFSAAVGTLAPKGLEYACLSIVLGTTCAEAISCIYAVVLYKIDKRQSSSENVSRLNALKKISSIAVPITLSNCLRSGLSTAENVLIPEGFKKMGHSCSKSLSIYGLIMGMVMPVITFPTAILYSASSLLIPELSEAKAINHKKSIKHVVNKSLYLSAVFSIIVAVIFAFFSNDLGKTIYHNTQTGTYIKILAPIVPFMYLDGIVDGMLKGLNQQTFYLICNIIDAIIRLLLIYFLLPIYGVYALIGIMFFSTIFNSLFSIWRLLKVTHIKLDIFNFILRPLFCSLISCSSSCFFLNSNYIPVFAYPVKLILEISLSLIIYTILLIPCHIIFHKVSSRVKTTPRLFSRQ